MDMILAINGKQSCPAKITCVHQFSPSARQGHAFTSKKLKSFTHEKDDSKQTTLEEDFNLHKVTPPSYVNVGL
jgi:hypothetical protein